MIVAGGLDWSSDLTGLAGSYPLTDFNLAIDAHIYPWKGDPANWDAKMGVAMARYALIVGEYGADPSWLAAWPSPQAFLNAAHDWVAKKDLGFAVWAMHPKGNPGMLTFRAGMLRPGRSQGGV